MVSAESLVKDEVTVVCCFYNRALVVRQTLESLLWQTHEKLKIIAVDDGSTDNTADELRKIVDPRLSVIHQRNQGFANTLERQCSEIRSEFIAIQGAGDISHKDRIAKQVQFMREHDNVVAVGCHVETVDLVTNNTTVDRSLPEVVSGPCFGGFEITHGELLMRNHIYRMAGGYQGKMVVGQMSDLLRRMSIFGDIGHVQDCLYQRFLRSDGVSSDATRLMKRRLLSTLSRVVFRTTVTQRGIDVIREHGWQDDLVRSHGIVAPYVLPRSKAMSDGLFLAAIEMHLQCRNDVAKILRSRAVTEWLSIRNLLIYALLVCSIELKISMARNRLARIANRRSAITRRLTEVSHKQPDLVPSEV